MFLIIERPTCQVPRPLPPPPPPQCESMATALENTNNTSVQLSLLSDLPTPSVALTPTHHQFLQMDIFKAVTIFLKTMDGMTSVVHCSLIYKRPSHFPKPLDTSKGNSNRCRAFVVDYFELRINAHLVQHDSRTAVCGFDSQGSGHRAQRCGSLMSFSSSWTTQEQIKLHRAMLVTCTKLGFALFMGFVNNKRNTLLKMAGIKPFTGYRLL